MLCSLSCTSLSSPCKSLRRAWDSPSGPGEEIAALGAVGAERDSCSLTGKCHDEERYPHSPSASSYTTYLLTVMVVFSFCPFWCAIILFRSAQISTHACVNHAAAHPLALQREKSFKMKGTYGWRKSLLTTSTVISCELVYLHQWQVATYTLLRKKDVGMDVVFSWCIFLLVSIFRIYAIPTSLFIFKRFFHFSIINFWPPHFLTMPLYNLACCLRRGRKCWPIEITLWVITCCSTYS